MSIVSDVIARLTGRYPQAPPSADDLVLLARPEGEAEALMWKEMLERHGIRSMTKNRDALSASYNIPGPVWAYELWVFRRNRDAAAEIIEPGVAAPEVEEEEA
jgi:hypothetical protein